MRKQSTSIDKHICRPFCFFNLLYARANSEASLVSDRGEKLDCCCWSFVTRDSV